MNIIFPDFPKVGNLLSTKGKSILRATNLPYFDVRREIEKLLQFEGRVGELLENVSLSIFETGFQIFQVCLTETETIAAFLKREKNIDIIIYIWQNNNFIY